MKWFVLALVSLVMLVDCEQSFAQLLTPPTLNPEIVIESPEDLGQFEGAFVLRTRNFDYIPELATNAVTQFAIGTNNDGSPLQPGTGHLHGWVFQLAVTPDRGRGRIKFGNFPPGRGITLPELNRHFDRPIPPSYFRFYGATSLTQVGINQFVLGDEFPPGVYKAYFQLQYNDHTPMLQATAPALPSIDTTIFWVK